MHGAHEAGAALPFVQSTIAWAQIALDAPAIILAVERMPPAGRDSAQLGTPQWDFFQGAPQGDFFQGAPQGDFFQGVASFHLRTS
jgi:hypothetical protein